MKSENFLGYLISVIFIIFSIIVLLYIFISTNEPLALIFMGFVSLFFALIVYFSQAFAENKVQKYLGYIYYVASFAFLYSYFFISKNLIYLIVITLFLIITLIFILWRIRFKERVNVNG